MYNQVFGEEINPEVFITVTPQCGMGVEILATDESLPPSDNVLPFFKGLLEVNRGSCVRIAYYNFALFAVTEINVQCLFVNREVITRAALLPDDQVCAIVEGSPVLGEARKSARLVAVSVFQQTYTNILLNRILYCIDVCSCAMIKVDLKEIQMA